MSETRTRPAARAMLVHVPRAVGGKLTFVPIGTPIVPIGTTCMTVHHIGFIHGLQTLHLIRATYAHDSRARRRLMLGQSHATSTSQAMAGRQEMKSSPEFRLTLGRTSPVEQAAIAPTKEPAGNVFRRIREGTRLSQRAFSQRFGIPLQTVRNLEQGRRNDGSRAVRFQYACVQSDPEQACLLADAAEALIQRDPDPSITVSRVAWDRAC